MFDKYDFCSYGPREPLCITRRGADVWWDQPKSVDGLHLFYDRSGRIGSVTMDDPNDPKSIKAAARRLGVWHWWLRRKIAHLAG